MKLVKASSMGFCRGVKRALDKAEEAASAASLRSITVYVYGDIVHSDAVMEHLSSLGILRIENAEEAEVPGIVIIRAHGIPDDEREAFLSRGFEIADATCPVVLSNQDNREEWASGGTCAQRGKAGCRHPLFCRRPEFAVARFL